MPNRGVITARNTVIRDGQLQVECYIAYLPTKFELSGEYMPINLADTVNTINDKIQQFGMDKINAEVPGAITDKNDVRLQNGFMK